MTARPPPPRGSEITKRTGRAAPTVATVLASAKLPKFGMLIASRIPAWSVTRSGRATLEM
jgi:hypothetical protein